MQVFLRFFFLFRRKLAFMPLSEVELEIARRLLFFRESLNIAQNVVAKGSKSSQGHLSEMETGQKSIRPRVILFLAERYSLNVDWLFTGRGKMQLNGTQMVSEPTFEYRRKESGAAMEERIRTLENQVRKLMEGKG